MTPTCARAIHAPLPSQWQHATCCATPSTIASIDYQLGQIVALAPTLDAEQLEAARATYRQGVARRKELVAADPHAIVRHYRTPETGNAGHVDCACGRTITAGSLALAQKAHTDHVRDTRLHDDPCVCGTYDRCKGVRAATAARTGNWRDLHRAYND